MAHLLLNWSLRRHPSFQISRFTASSSTPRLFCIASPTAAQSRFSTVVRIAWFLSLGSIGQDRLRCLYNSLAFDRFGACVRKLVIEAQQVKRGAGSDLVKRKPFLLKSDT